MREHILNLFFQSAKVGLFVGFIMGCTAPPPLPKNFSLSQPRPDIPLTSPQAVTDFQSFPINEDDYQLGRGDEVTIEIWGYPELSGKHIIGPDGKVTLPLVGPSRLIDLSREQAAEFVKTKLSSYYTNLSVALRVDRYISNRVLVLGRVSHPGEVTFGMSAPTLLEAITLAGGIGESRNGGGSNLPSTRCAIFRGRNQVIWIALEPLLMGKDLSLNLKLKRNDIVYVPELEEKLIYVLGEVRNPGAVPLTPYMSFIEALAKAGGPTIDAASNRIHLIRPKEGINQPLALNDFITPKQNINAVLQEGDIIYVPMNTIAKVNYAVRFLTPFSTVLGIYANIESIKANRQQRQLDNLKENLESERAVIDAQKEAIENQTKILE